MVGMGAVGEAMARPVLVAALVGMAFVQLESNVGALEKQREGVAEGEVSVKTAATLTAVLKGATTGAQATAGGVVKVGIEAMAAVAAAAVMAAATVAVEQVVGEAAVEVVAKVEAVAEKMAEVKMAGAAVAEEG